MCPPAYRFRSRQFGRIFYYGLMVSTRIFFAEVRYHSICCTASNVDVSTRQAARLSVRQPEHLMLPRPCDRRIEQAGHADPVRQTTLDGALRRD
jgi:hypothetical protein